MTCSGNTVLTHYSKICYALIFPLFIPFAIYFILGILNEGNASVHIIIKNSEKFDRNINGTLSKFEFFFQKCDYLMENNISITLHSVYSICWRLCSITSYELVGRITPNLSMLSLGELESKFRMLKPGGLYSPYKCVSRHKVAIIIAYRNREEHLRILLNNLHPLLQNEELEYGIFVIEQEEGYRFNRAMLMNIGFKEVVSMYDFECFIYHDVDHLPENDLNMYTCSDNPRHMAVAVDKFGYNLIYGSYFGGVSSLSKSQMEAINGFPNRYFGWGGEDDDIYTRLMKNNYTIVRYAMNIARYRTIRHPRDRGNEDNDDRMQQLTKTAELMQLDGLNSLKYSLLSKEHKKLYTLIQVRINETEVKAQLSSIQSKVPAEN